MKESLPDIVLLLEVDRTATASSASNESRSLQLLLVLHTLVGGAELRRANGQLGMYQLPSAQRDPAASWTGTRARVTSVCPACSWRQPATWKVHADASADG